ncbi:hypothetical protein [Clostridium sp. HBUAS56010]|uniref:hypothetical protein n=1 Tax=Clostridium sp. HBUAS56010 TaxID=2571127 RepID=UPI0011773C1B|nr:hypothetical protein [Clostridium sp. HBUAS56010]
MKQRIKEHIKNDDWCDKENYKVEYIEENIVSRTDAEYFEAHYISLFKTDQYYNKSKTGWGISTFLPVRNDWIEYKDRPLEFKELKIHKTQEKEFRHNSKPILQFDKNKKLVKHYNSIKEASECTEFTRCLIVMCAKSNMKRFVSTDEYGSGISMTWEESWADHFNETGRSFYYFKFA